MAEKKQEQGQRAEVAQPSKGLGKREQSSTIQRGGEGELGTYGWTMSPFGFVRRMMEDMDRLFGEFGYRGLAPAEEEEISAGEIERERIWSPQVEVFQREGNLVVRADLPGTDLKDIKVNVDENGLTLSGERHHEKEWESEGVYQSERSYGSFERRIPLPRGIDASTCDANFDNGVLEVSMKLPKERARTVEIRGKKVAEPQIEGAKPIETAAPSGTTAEPQPPIEQPYAEKRVQRH